MNPTVQELLSLCGLRGWTAGGGGEINLKEVSQAPVQQVESTLLEDVRVHQD